MLWCYNSTVVDFKSSSPIVNWFYMFMVTIQYYRQGYFKGRIHHLDSCPIKVSDALFFFFFFFCDNARSSNSPIINLWDNIYVQIDDQNTYNTLKTDKILIHHYHKRGHQTLYPTFEFWRLWLVFLIARHKHKVWSNCSFFFIFQKKIITLKPCQES